MATPRLAQRRTPRRAPILPAFVLAAVAAAVALLTPMPASRRVGLLALAGLAAALGVVAWKVSRPRRR